MKNYLHKSTFKGIKGELMLVKQADHMCFRQFQYIGQEESKIGDDVIKLTGLNKEEVEAISKQIADKGVK